MTKATSDDGESHPSNTLQRGKACLRCRKRKMRCDGGPGACNQCKRSKRGDACEYDDGKGKTRTQILRDTIDRLQQRVKDLEDPEYVHQHVQLHDPRRSSASLTLVDPSATPSISAANSPFSSGSSRDSWNGADYTSPSPTPMVLIGNGYAHPETSLPPYEIAMMMINTFEPHRFQCGLEIHMDTLRASLALPLHQQRHPALLHAIYLWACSVSGPDGYGHHEEHYLACTLAALKVGLRTNDRIVDVVQAMCMLSTYFLSHGRLVEGSFHCSAAAALATQCGLHQPVVQDSFPWTAAVSYNQLRISPATSEIEQRERNLAFWQVFNLDRCWSVILGKPVVIPDGRQGWNSVNVPWPQSFAEYEMGHQPDGTGFQTMRTFLSGGGNGGFSSLAQRAKASGLFHLAQSMAANWDQRTSLTANFHDDAQALEAIIQQFKPTLLPMFQVNGLPVEEKTVLVATHVLLQAAIIQLYQRLSRDDPMCYDRCLSASREIVGVLKHISDTDYDYLDPIIGPCCCSAAEILVYELDSIEVSWPLLSTTDVRNDIGIILYALSNFDIKSGWIASTLGKIQKRLVHV